MEQQIDGDSLLSMQKEWQQGLDRVTQAIEREKNKVACPDDSHVDKCLLVVLGARPSEFMARHPEYAGGYKVYRCLACHKWFITSYGDNDRMEITESMAVDLTNGIRT